MLLSALTAKSVTSPWCPRHDARSSALSTLQICTAQAVKDGQALSEALRLLSRHGCIGLCQRHATFEW